jgi:hypothetical protein
MVDGRAVPSGAQRLDSLAREGVSVRVRLTGLDRLASAQAVTQAIEAVTDQQWAVAPTAGGTVLALGDASVASVTLAALARWLESAGYDGAIVRNMDSWDSLERQATNALPVPASAVLAFTIDPPYEDGPFNDFGVVAHRWGVPHEITVACAREWVEWAVPDAGLATVVPALIDVTREDALDVLVPHVEHAHVDCRLFGSQTGSSVVRVVRARHFGEVMLTEAGSGKARIPQALEMLHEHVLPHAAQVDYATVRVTRTNTHRWVTDAEIATRWNFKIRQLWSQYVADPNGIQILTDAHLDKARDLTTRWDVTPVCPGRWLVQAKDLSPWFDTIDEECARYHRPYLDPDLVSQARHDFGDMVLTPEIASANSVRGPKRLK